MSRFFLLALCCTGALLLSGCSRQSDDSPPLDPAFALPTPEPLAARISNPSEGDSLVSPFVVSGRAPDGQGNTVAVQVKSLTPEGEWRWIGNLALDVDEGGRFEGEVSYSLADAAPGALELLVIDQESGTVLETTEVSVELGPSP